MPTTYDLVRDARALVLEIEQTGEFDTMSEDTYLAAFYQRVMAWVDASADKAEAIAAVYRRAEQERKALSVEKDRIVAAMDRFETLGERLKASAYALVAEHEALTGEAKLGPLRLQRSPPSLDGVYPVDPATLPERFKRVSVSINRAAIIEFLKDGGELEAFKLVTDRRHVRFV
jgi:hypothetical protein